MGEFTGDMADTVDIIQMAVCCEAISEEVFCETSAVAVDGNEGRFILNFGGRSFTIVITENAE